MATPGVKFVRTSTNVNTSEGNALVTGILGDKVTYDVVLTTQPGNGGPNFQVVLDFISSDVTEGTVTSRLIFTPANWNIPQTVTVQGVDDMKGQDVTEGVVGGNVAEGAVSYTISAVVNQQLTTALEYRPIFVPTQSLKNNDDIEDRPINDQSGGNYGKDDPAKNMVDYMVGSNLNDKLYGGRGSDGMQGGFGNDKLYGQDGADVINGQQGNDTLWGGYEDDILTGDDGNDQINGEQDNDSLTGGNGNDTLDGGVGADTMQGNAGNDTYRVDDLGDKIDDQGLASDVDTVTVDIAGTVPYTYVLPAQIENAELQGILNSSLMGNAVNNYLVGNGGNNVLNGGWGNDNESGGDGGDLLIGGLGTDTLNGGGGNDTLNGSEGNDVLIGSVGGDVFVFNVAINVTGVDKVDFNVLADTIKLENAIYTKLTATGVLNADYFKAGTAAADANDYVIYNKADGSLFYDADGNGAGVAVKIAMLGAGLAVTNADFVVI